MPGEPTHQQLQKEERIQKLKAAVNLKVADLCTELESELGVKFTPEVIASLGYLAFDKTQRSAEDLEAFAQHAKRTNVTGDDVKLLTRRNTNLHGHLASLQKEAPSSKTGSGIKNVKKTTKKKNENRDNGDEGGRAPPSGSHGVQKFIQPLID